MASYNPGTPTLPVRVGRGVYIIDSFRGEGTSYRVDLNGTPRCSCPHYVTRLAGSGSGQACKHIAAATAERNRAIRDLAANTPTDHLTPLLKKYKKLRRWEVTKALWIERWDRTQVGA
jgi:predicted nucleic acid-binding Zn finger protein